MRNLSSRRPWIVYSAQDSTLFDQQEIDVGRATPQDLAKNVVHDVYGSESLVHVGMASLGSGREKARSPHQA